MNHVRRSNSVIKFWILRARPFWMTKALVLWFTHMQFMKNRINIYNSQRKQRVQRKRFSSSFSKYIKCNHFIPKSNPGWEQPSVERRMFFLKKNEKLHRSGYQSKPLHKVYSTRVLQYSFNVKFVPKTWNTFR